MMWSQPLLPRRLVRAAALAAVALPLGCSDDPPEPLPNLLEQPTALIISPDDMVGELERLADWRRRGGVSTQLVMLSEALAEGEGPDDAARLRDYLRGRWEQGSITSVALAGDAGVVPVRQIHLEVNIETESIVEEADVATELYFSDLDADWDPDGDGIYGEPEDETDLLPDLALGRLPFDSPAQAREYVDKLMRYEHAPGSAFESGYEQRVLLAAGYAGYDVHGSAGLEGYLVPEMPEHLELTRLYSDYEQRPGSEDFTAPSMLAALAAGQSITFMMGHGNETSMGALDGLAEVAGIDNGSCPSIFVTCECLGGRFDWADSDTSGETFVLGPSGGVAYLGSTNLGVGYPSLTLVMQQLVRALYDPRPEPARLGVALQGALRGYSQQHWLHERGNMDRWTQFVTVLLGDPSTVVWTGPARTSQIQKVDGDGCQWATFQVTDAGGAAVPQATVTAYAADRVLLVAHTDEQGEGSLAGDGCLLEGVVITATGRDLVPSSLEL